MFAYIFGREHELKEEKKATNSTHKLQLWKHVKIFGVCEIENVELHIKFNIDVDADFR